MRDAIKYKISRRELYNTLDCESQHFIDVTIQSKWPDKTGPNGKEDSWGVSQIHLPDHPEVTREMAQDPVFAIDYAAQMFAEGRANQFTCYRLLKT